MANSKRRCRQCKDYALVDTGRIINNGFYCSDDCAIQYAIQASAKLREKKERTDIRKAKERIKTRAEHLREAQTAFNAFIRERDKGLPCISCGRHHQGQFHAGHYLSVGAHPEMRFDERNVYLQCAPCNNHLSGNIVEYRKNLIVRYGQKVVDYLESKHEAKKYTVEQIKEIKSKYRLKLKELKKQKVA
jgi:hypothetical protein